MKSFILRYFLPAITLFIVSIVIETTGCKKRDIFNTDSSTKLNMSTDQILFDTVFTTVGSTTKMFYVKNPTKENLKISNIRLAGGSTSQFSMNVDGVPGFSFDDIELLPEDSIFIFVKVTVDPQNSNSPLVVKDSVLFYTNGNEQKVQLTAWGQDAHYIVADKSIGSLRYKIVADSLQNVTWTDDKPYLIYGYAVVDSYGQLNIEEGCRIHFFSNSGLWVYKFGTLRVNGTIANPVTFQGSRLEQAYKEEPGQWDRIWINEGNKDNVIKNAIIKNGFIGIQAETMDSPKNNRLILENVFVRNMSGIGLLSRYYKIIGANSVFANCGYYALCLTEGGKYDFRHCTVGNYWNYSTTRQTPSVVVSNYYQNPATNTVYSGDLDSAYFANCIFYGLNSEELLLDSLTNAHYEYKFQNCLFKTERTLGNSSRFVNCIKNMDPMFKDKDNQDYRLMAGSGAIDQGNLSILYMSATSAINLLDDMLGNDRQSNPPPDLGAYDYHL